MNTRKSTKRRVGLVTEEIFNEVKTLSNYKGITNQTVAEVTKLGKSTVGRIKSCESYAAYKAHIHDLKMRAKTEKQLDEIVKANPLPEPMNTSERIACALERLADAWEAHPKAKPGLFR